MSVLKNKRTLSDLEFYHNAIELRRELTLLMLRDFGVKDKIRDVVPKIDGMTKEDRDAYNRLLERYGQLQVIEEYPNWFISKARGLVMNVMSDIIKNIIQANSIYPVCESDYYERRSFQSQAIGSCELLLQELQYIISIIPVDVNKYIQYTDMIEREIALLRGWRKKDNRFLRAIRKEEEKKQAEKDKNAVNKDTADESKNE